MCVRSIASRAYAPIGKYIAFEIKAIFFYVTTINCIVVKLERFVTSNAFDSILCLSSTSSSSLSIAIFLPQFITFLSFDFNRI